MIVLSCEGIVHRLQTVINKAIKNSGKIVKFPSKSRIFWRPRNRFFLLTMTSFSFVEINSAINNTFHFYYINLQEKWYLFPLFFRMNFLEFSEADYPAAYLDSLLQTRIFWKSQNRCIYLLNIYHLVTLIKSWLRPDH